MKGHLPCFLAMLMAFTACKRDSTPPAPERETKQAVSIESTPAETPPPVNSTTTATKPSDPEPAPTEPLEPPKEIETINSKLNEYLDEGKPLPKDIADLVRLKIIQRLPAAPPGKKLVIDQTKRRVIMVNQ